MKTAISISDELFNAAEDAARRLGVSRSELYRKALREFLAKHDARTVTEALNGVYGHRTEASRVDSRLAELQRASLPDDEW